MKRLFACALGMVGLSACTSIHWTGRAGAEHHAGLLFVRVTELPHGRSKSVVGLGLDLDLTEEQSGYALGYRAVEREYPEEVVFESLPEMVQQVSDYLCGRGAPEAKARSRWFFFYFKDEEASRTASIDSRSFGASVRTGPAHSELSLGYSRREYVTPYGVSEDGVLMCCADRSGDHAGFVRWSCRIAP